MGNFAKITPDALAYVPGVSKSSSGDLSLIGAVWKIDAGFKWTFLKGAADLVVNGIDLANTWSPLLKSTRYGQNYRMQIFDMTRTVSVSFVYRFHGFQPKNYEVDSSRFGTGK